MRGAMAFALASLAADKFGEQGEVIRTCVFYIVSAAATICMCLLSHKSKLARAWAECLQLSFTAGQVLIAVIL